jgi:site-specific DNA-methyltransferase (adenine-specific)
MKLNTIICGDCLSEMPKIADKSIDMILCDLPYGITAHKWDTIIPFEPLWEQYKRIIKDNGAIVLTASQPFTSALVMSNPDMFKVEWIWEKNAGSNFATVKYMPMREHENILVFSKQTTKYNPIKEERMDSGKSRVKSKFQHKTNTEIMGGKEISQKDVMMTELRVPRSIQRFNRERGLHPTQKPVALFEYLIKTYTNEGDLVLDNAAGSGTTGVACKKSNRNFIMIEKDENYCKIAEDRLKQEVLL